MRHPTPRWAVPGWTDIRSTVTVLDSMERSQVSHAEALRRRLEPQEAYKPHRLGLLVLGVEGGGADRRPRKPLLLYPCGTAFFRQGAHPFANVNDSRYDEYHRLEGMSRGA